MITLEDLEIQCQNNTLTEFLKELSLIQLYNLTRLVLCDDIIGIRVNIYVALSNELDYRESLNNTTELVR